jgi:hypothetical protein
MPAQIVGGHSVDGGAGVEVFAQFGGRVNLAIRGLFAVQGQHRRPGPLQGDLGLAGRGRRQGHLVEPGDSVANPVDRGDAGGSSGSVFGLQHHRDTAGLVAEVLFERVADRLRLRAGNVEAAPGQVIGLVRGDR